MSSANVPRRAAQAMRQGVATFLGIAGIVAIVIGLLYLLAARNLPFVLQGSIHANHHPHRAEVSLVAGAGCLAVAWLIRVRHRN